MATTPDLDLNIISITGRESGGGAWVRGTVDDRYKFDALVFAEHAESEDYELQRSRISKLWIYDLRLDRAVFNFDRGPDIAAANAETAIVVGFLCEGLADLIHG